jgi:hypothetical protein
VLENALISGIKALKANTTDDDAMYDLSGRRLPKGTRKKGIVIRRGIITVNGGNGAIDPTSGNHDNGGKL